MFSELAERRRGLSLSFSRQGVFLKYGAITPAAYLPAACECLAGIRVRLWNAGKRRGERRITILSGHPAQEPALVDRGGAGHLSERRAEEGDRRWTIPN